MESIQHKQDNEGRLIKDLDELTEDQKKRLSRVIRKAKIKSGNDVNDLLEEMEEASND